MDFNKKFETYSNADLVRVIENADDYQSQAVEAAKMILADRQLSENEIEIAKSEIEKSEKSEKSEKEQQEQTIEHKVINAGKSIFDRLNPLQKGIPNSEKVIRGVSIFLGALFLFRLYRVSDFLIFMHTNVLATWEDFGFFMMLLLSGLFVLFAATILFFKKKKAGWLLTTVFLTYSAFVALGQIMMRMEWRPLGIRVLDDFLSQFPTLTYLVILLIFSSIIWDICRENVRTVFPISKQTAILTITITGLVVGFVISLNFWG